MKATVVSTGALAPGHVLTPVRYDPIRLEGLGVALGSLVDLVRDPLDPRRHGASGGERFVVLDTGHACDGIVFHRQAPVPGGEVGSLKYLLQPGDVIISRLRPYLRQVAWMDPGLFSDPGVALACSTEFYVLRGQGMAWLVPFLLSPPVQAILAAAQEGGHHPRFNRETLLGLKVPPAWMREAPCIAARVERCIQQVRRARMELDQLMLG